MVTPVGWEPLVETPVPPPRHRIGASKGPKTDGVPTVSPPIPLNMVPTSVDDMYNGCRPKMYWRVNNKYLEEDKSLTDIFKQSWTTAEKCARSKTITDNLTLQPIQALCAYSARHPAIYNVFNEACRTGNSVYTSSFKFRSLHFLLTEAILLLKENPDQNRCYTTYRRTNMEFTGKVNTEMRFGFFASSSFRKDLTHFGEKSCFEIKTCFGASINPYSVCQDEKVVLIPPYEVFKITEVIKKEDAKDLWCDVVYKLWSIKTQSDLNCKLVISK
ncbi:NAD(P)(+)--arginine ADP-ribosyltransferase 2-like [Oncorhynchus clarkii lewisi]|uniref:NAD(P)(+)--arginine ADP-ribosyltransferase 2-like n=1 Tax=Oncorhynchus clarkii lewisi TaxID=490388 RepID=UPI0039B88E32